MLKTFGEYAGSQLLYWPDDTGEEPDLRVLPLSQARSFDAKRGMLLFDGTRCHCVAPFEGEKYSLVFFFTASEYQKVKAAASEHLVDLGITWPTGENLHYYRHLLSLPRGKSQSIRLMIG